MSTMTVSDVALDTGTPAQRLRRIATAVRVHFTWWGTRRTLTREQKEEAAQPFGAEGQFLSAGKKLIDTRHEAFRPLTSLRSRIIQFWRGLTLPYVENGTRLIRQSDIEVFVHAMEDFRSDLRQAEANLNHVYDAIKADARRQLGRLFNADDYPSEIRSLFGVDWEFPNVEPPSFLLRLSPEIYEQERARVAARFEDAVRLAEDAFATELASLVAHLTERLTLGADGQRKVFRDSAIANFAEYFERFRRLNIRSSDQLDSLVAQAQDLLRGVTPEQVRTLPDVRQQLHTGMEDVRQQLDHLVIDAPRRRIIRNHHPENA